MGVLGLFAADTDDTELVSVSDAGTMSPFAWLLFVRIGVGGLGVGVLLLLTGWVFLVSSFTSLNLSTN